MTPSRPTATRMLPLDATALKSLAEPEARDVHVTPSGEVRMRPSPKSPPTATYWLPSQITAQITSLVPESSVVHVSPSDEVMISPFQPTRRNWLPFQTMSFGV